MTARHLAWPSVSLAMTMSCLAGDAATLPEDFTRHDILRYLHGGEATTVEDFIGALPPLHKRHVALVFQSDGLAKDHVSIDSPRVVSWGADAQFVLSWGTDPGSPFYETVEFLRPNRDRWIAGVVDFSRDPPEIREPAVCSTCHGHDHKPLWGQFPNYEGTERDSGSAGYDAIERILRSTDPRLSQLEFGSRERVLRFPGGRLAEVVREAGNVLGWRHAEILFNRLATHEDYPQIAEQALCAEPSVFTAMFPLSARHLAVRADSGTIIQGGGIYHSLHRSYSFGYGSLFGAFQFLILHDLWMRDAAVGPALGASGDEIGRLHDQHFGARGLASLAARGETTHPAGPVGSGQIMEGLVRQLGPATCGVLAGGDPGRLVGRPGAATAAVTRIVLVDALRDRDLREVREGDTINLRAYSTERFAIRADVWGDSVGRVDFALSNAAATLRYARSEYVVPYALHGDDGAGNYFGASLPEGDYYVTATPYVQPEAENDQQRCLGKDNPCEVGMPLTVRFSVNRNAFARFAVVSVAETDEDVTMRPVAPPASGSVVPSHAASETVHVDEFIGAPRQTIEDGAVLDRNALPERVDIRAELWESATVDSIRLALTGPDSMGHVRISARTPYELFGDRVGETLTVGDYRLTASSDSGLARHAAAEGAVSTGFSVRQLSGDAMLGQVEIGEHRGSTSGWSTLDNPELETNLVVPTERITVRAKPSHPGASVTVSDDDGRMPFGEKAVHLRTGSNSIAIEVTAENGRKRTYKLNVTRD